MVRFEKGWLCVKECGYAWLCVPLFMCVCLERKRSGVEPVSQLDGSEDKVIR